MATVAHAPARRSALTLLLGVPALLLVAAVVANLHRTLGIGDRTAFIILFVLGFAMCAVGPLGQGANYGWGKPRHLAGYGIGVAALGLGVAVLMRWPHPLVADERSATLALAAIMLVKFAIGRTYPRIG